MKGTQEPAILTCMSHLFLELEDAVHQCFTGRRASRDVDINGHNSITSSCNTVAPVIITSSIRARTHTDHPSWIRHLVIYLT